MILTKSLKFLLVASIVGIIAGCKLAVIVVEGGEVQSTGSGTCVAGTICIVEVTDTNFSESFTAVPDEGWVFENWISGDGFWCPDYTGPVCPVSSEGAEGIPWAEALIASSDTFYLMPIFKQQPPDTVLVNGILWLQPDLFTELSWNDINAVCDANTGVCSGVLNGYDMNGWTWASIDDVNALFNYYVGTDELGPGPDITDQITGWTHDLFNDGWRGWYMPIVYDVISPGVRGWMRRLNNETSAYIALIFPLPPESPGWLAATSEVYEIDQNETYIGAWFYRTP